MWLLQGGRLVSGIETDGSGAITALASLDAATGAEERHEADAIVFAISIAGKHCDVLCYAVLRCDGLLQPHTAPPGYLSHYAHRACLLRSPQACSAWCRPILRWLPARSSATSWISSQVSNRGKERGSKLHLVFALLA
jgi:hypothetical protein